MANPFKVRIHHLAHKFFESNLVAPAEKFLGTPGVALPDPLFGPLKGRILPKVLRRVQAGLSEGDVDKLTDSPESPCCQHQILRDLEVRHADHAAREAAGMPPVALCIKVPENEKLLLTVGDPGCGERNLP